MLKKGDKVVCIDNHYEFDRLTLNAIYTIEEYFSYDEFGDDFVKLFESDIRWLACRFCKLSTNRKFKLKNINYNKTHYVVTKT